MIMKVLKTKKISDFLKLSYEFSRSLGYANTTCNRLIDVLVKNGFTGSTALFGQTVFTIVKENELKTIDNISKDFPAKLFISDIENEGARLIRKNDA
jgi:pantoate kinase